MPAHRNTAATQGLRSSITMLILVLIVAFGAWFGWQSVKGDTSEPQLVAACPVPNQTPGAPVVRPSEVRVNVYNATIRAGLGASTADGLKARGFQVLVTENDPLRKQIPEAAEVRANQAHQAAAALVAAQVPNSKIVFDDRPDDAVDLVIGDAFQGLAVRQTAASEPPAPDQQEAPEPAATPDTAAKPAPNPTPTC